jgi:hypothetical protein
VIKKSLQLHNSSPLKNITLIQEPVLFPLLPGEKGVEVFLKYCTSSPFSFFTNKNYLSVRIENLAKPACL